MCSMCSLLEIESVGHMGAQTTPRDVIIMLLGVVFVLIREVNVQKPYEQLSAWVNLPVNSYVDDVIDFAR